MLQKNFISFEQVRNNALLMAQNIVESSFIPDIVYVSLRGGAYLGNVLSEYLRFFTPEKKRLFYAAVVAHSYTNIKSQQQVRVDGWTYDPKYLRSGDRVLFVDDIYDSGHTINHLVNIILARGIPREDIRVAVHDYKVYQWKSVLPIIPDFWCRQWVIENPENDVWIHYLSHELVGLTDEEIEQHYIKQDQSEELKTLLRGIPKLGK